MVSVEFLSIRNICLPRAISAARRRELLDPIEDRKVHRCHVQQKVFSQWCKRGRERVVRTMFSDNGEHPTNQSGVAATCATLGIPITVCVITGACPGARPA